jgi:hypothetical protein
MDNLFKKTNGKLSLEYRIHQKDIGEPESVWNPVKIYTFPKNTTKIVYFFNYSESHWTLLEMNLGKDPWNAAKGNCHLLENLVQAALGIPPPEKPSKIESGLSIKQINYFDCGALAVVNALVILFGRKTEQWSIDCNKVRLTWLTLLNEKLGTPEPCENKVEKSTPEGSGATGKNCLENTFTDHIGNFIQNTTGNSEYTSTTSTEDYFNSVSPDRPDILWRRRNAASKALRKRPKNGKGKGNSVSLGQDFTEMHFEETIVPLLTASRVHVET